MPSNTAGGSGSGSGKLAHVLRRMAKRVSDKSAFLESYLNDLTKKEAPTPALREVLLVLDLYFTCMPDDADGASDLRKKNYAKLFTVLSKTTLAGSSGFPGRSGSIDALPTRGAGRVLKCMKGNKESGKDASLSEAADAWYSHFFAKQKVSVFVCRHFLAPAVSPKSLDHFLGSDVMGSETAVKSLKEMGNEEAAAALFVERSCEGKELFPGFSEKFVPAAARLLKRQPESVDGLFSAVVRAMGQRAHKCNENEVPIAYDNISEADAKTLLSEGFDLLKTTSSAKRAIGERVVEGVVGMASSNTIDEVVSGWLSF